MVKENQFQRDFERLSKKLESLTKEIEEIMPKAIIRKTSTFGNSAHIVLSKDLLDKEVGIIVLKGEESRGA